jgi:hypothetical protein
MRVDSITEFHVSLELNRQECEVLETIARVASTVDFEHVAEAERYQALFQLAVQAMRAADYDSARGKTAQ